VRHRVLVAQKGAREHFLAARALHRHGLLAGLATDWYAPQSGAARALLRFLGKHSAASALAAECDEIPRELVRAFPVRSLLWKWSVRRGATLGRLYEAFTQTDAAFARAVAQCALPLHEVFFGYSYASLEMIELENRRGRLTVVVQIDPGAVEYRLVAEEMTQHPELAGPPAPFPSGYYDRARREWELADIIIVNSEWSRDAVVTEGGDAGKIEILPLGFEGVTGPQRTECRRPRGGSLRVLWLGQVNVRKGIHYLLQAARILENEAIEIQVAGPIGIRRSVLAEAPNNVRWLGPVPRGKTSDLYDRCDVFVLPTLSDGFAITQLEALAHGLPVIVTPNCGRVVEDGKTGFLVPARDAEALARAIMNFVSHPGLALEMSSNCQRAAQAYSIDAYGKRLIEIVEQNLAARQRTA
jgi:glycosyltransferase involved in cell wall biosynthesis